MSILRCMIIKLLKTKGKEKSQKQADKNDNLPEMKKTMWIMVYFSSENTKARRKWHNIFKCCQIRVPQPAKISFRNEEKMKTFSDEGKVWGFVTNRTILKEWQKEIL